MSRLVGIDYGRARVGVAISDETRFLARPLCRLDNTKRFFEQLKTELKTYKVEAIVVGLPLLMNGKEGPMTAEVRQFAQLLEQTIGLPIIFWDERLTSAEAERSLKDAGFNRKKRAQESDTLAASLILQSYLDTQRSLSR